MASSTSSNDIEELSDDQLSPGRGRQLGRSRRGRGRGGSRSRSSGRGSRGRGSRGRGSGSRGRAREQRLGRSDKERVEELWKQRKQQMKAVVEEIDTEKLRSLVLKLIDREPGLVFDQCETAGDGGPNPPGGLRPSGDTAPSWCKCGKCQEMGSDIENKCCGCLPRNCVSTRDEMERLALDPQVLAIGHSYFTDMLGWRGQRVDNNNKRMRLSGYQNFTLWRHGRLGAGVRRVIPSCCVLKIRERYPSATGTYTGFIPGRYI